jgi:phage regulator Rha-like protein
MITALTCVILMLLLWIVAYAVEKNAGLLVIAVMGVTVLSAALGFVSAFDTLEKNCMQYHAKTHTMADAAVLCRKLHSGDGK